MDEFDKRTPAPKPAVAGARKIWSAPCVIVSVEARDVNKTNVNDVDSHATSPSTQMTGS